MPMLAAVTCLARRRRMHCRGSATAAALELDQGQHDPGDHRHRWRDERAEPPAHVGMPGREPAELPRAPLPHASRRQGRRRVPRDGGPPAPLGSRRPRQTVTAAGAELAPTQEEARSQPGPGSSSAAVALKKKAPDAAGRVARRAARRGGDRERAGSGGGAVARALRGLPRGGAGAGRGGGGGGGDDDDAAVLPLVPPRLRAAVARRARCLPVLQGRRAVAGELTRDRWGHGACT